MARQIQARIHDRGQKYGKDANEYERLKGEAAGLHWVLAKMDEIAEGPQEDQEETEDILV